MNTKSLVIGMGQTGKALAQVLGEYYEVETRDREDKDVKDVGVMHICVGHHDSFVEMVKEYKEQYNPDHTIIHSTVPVGTSRECGATHSPIRGIHPKLRGGLETFTKFIGGSGASEVADYFRRAGFTIYLFDKQETTELMKIWSTTWFGNDIEKTKQIKKDCDRLDVPFAAWTVWVDTYNTGYTRLGHPEYTRPNLVPIMKKIGGHCVLPNAEFLDNKFARVIEELNKDES